VHFPSSDRRLDYLAQIETYAIVNENYFRRTFDTPLIPTLVMLRKPPKQITKMPVMWTMPKYKGEGNQVVRRSLSEVGASALAKKTYAGYRRMSPNTLLGRYISASSCRVDAVYEPAEAVPCHHFRKEELLPWHPGRPLVDISKPRAAEELRKRIIELSPDPKVDFIYFDNVDCSPRGVGGTPIKWQDVLTHLQRLKAPLHQRGLRVVINASCVPLSLAANHFEVARQMTEYADGISLEMAFSRHARLSLEAIQREISVLRYWLDQKKLVLLMALYGRGVEGRLRETELFAALMMLMRKQGDRYFLGRFHWRTRADFVWREWPQEFGLPQEEMQGAAWGEGGWMLSRRFAKGTIRVLHHDAKKGQTILLPLPGGAQTRYKLLKKPMEGMTWGLGGTRFAYRAKADAASLFDHLVFTVEGRKEIVIVDLYFPENVAKPPAPAAKKKTAPKKK
jgi:hypothetical protein